jgi:hypothetical protein
MAPVRSARRKRSHTQTRATHITAKAPSHARMTGAGASAQNSMQMTPMPAR